MIKHFEDEPTWPNGALQIWLILVGKASNGQTVTYGQLAHMLGHKGAGLMAQPPGHILHYCKQNKLPPLNVLAVNKGTGWPSDGAGPSSEIDREEVFAYNWFGIFPPTPQALKEAWDHAFPRPQKRLPRPRSPRTESGV